MGCVYKISNNVNGKVYVGQTIQTVKQRMQQHICSAVTKRSNAPIHGTMRKYGPMCFSIEIIAECETVAGLSILEKDFIQQYKSFDRKCGYNISLGGWSHSEETRQKISSARKGRPLSQETKQKLSLAMIKLGRKPPRELRGPWSEESKKKLSESKRGVPRPKEAVEKMMATKRSVTHCKKNHLFDEENTYWSRSGKRGCRKCRYDYGVRQRAKIKLGTLNS